MKKFAGCLVTAAALALSVGHADADFSVSGCESACDVSSCDSCLSCDNGCDVAGCDLLGCDGAGCCDDFGCGKRLLGLIKQSDHCFDDFISPMINPVFFEDPRTLTEARAIYARHETPNSVGTLGLPGGNVQLFAVQMRAALTDRLSIIAVKDGFLIADFDQDPLAGLIKDGWMDVSAGLKYNLIRDTQRGTLASAGFTYELPIGSQRTQQDIGDGEFHMFGTFGQRFANGNAHWLSAAGYRLPVDGSVQSSAIHWSNHFDVKTTCRTYLFTEFALWHWTDSSDTGLPLGVGGQDLFNLSSTNMTDRDLLTQNVGMKYKPNGNIETGLAYEFPLTGGRDIIDNRLQAELIFRY